MYTKPNRLNKKEYYTFMFLPGPNEKVRTLIVSKRILKSVLLSLAALTFLSVYLFYQYKDAKNKAWELQSAREELMQQRVQVQGLALNLLDYKRQMFFLRDLDTKLRRVVSLAPRDKAKQAIGIGGPEDTKLQNLVHMGEKKQDEQIKEMHQELSKMRVAASRQETSLQLLIEHFEDKRSLYASTPSIWPVRGWVTSPFGRRISPFSGIPAFHEGLDIAAQVGTPVLAPADGVVIKAAFSPGYGNMVEIRHGYGIRTIYGHNSRINVQEGQHVTRRDVIAYVGDTGSSTGPHLHYEVRQNGLPINPVKYLNY